jgi:hypothetical protein
MQHDVCPSQNSREASNLELIVIEMLSKRVANRTSNILAHDAVDVFDLDEVNTFIIARYIELIFR